MNRLPGALFVAAVSAAIPIAAGPSTEEPIQWHATYEAAQTAARRTGKPIFAAFR